MKETKHINEKFVYFVGNHKARVKCDRQCSKAWGISSRPADDDDRYLADHELGDAPEDPGTSEGHDSKPVHPDDFPNKWCIRECERSAISPPGKWAEDLSLTDWSERVKT